jgi:gag-polypeptide of LTR copia-type/Zinc knuckle
VHEARDKGTHRQGRHVSSDVQYELKCEDDANVHKHLESLMRMHGQLAGMNVALTDDDLVTIILGSLPKSYRPLINAITMSVAHAKAKLEPDQVVGTLIDEFEQLTIEEHQLKANENALTAANGRRKPQARGGNSSTTKTDAECWKCGKKGHVKVDCRSKAKKKDKKDDDKSRSSPSFLSVNHYLEKSRVVNWRMQLPRAMDSPSPQPLLGPRLHWVRAR